MSETPEIISTTQEVGVGGGEPIVRQRPSWWRRLLGLLEPPEEEDCLEGYHAMRRAQDPDYDRKRAAHIENVKLRARRDMLAQERENERLRAEIAELKRGEQP